MMKWLVKFVREDEGATAVEYAIMVAGIAAVIIAVVIVVGSQTNSAFSTADSAIKTIP